MHSERCTSGSARGHAKPLVARPEWRACPTQPYIRLGAEFVYLAVLRDAYSRKVVGWALDRTLAARLPIAVSSMRPRRP